MKYSPHGRLLILSKAQPVGAERELVNDIGRVMPGSMEKLAERRLFSLERYPTDKRCLNQKVK